MLSEEQFDVWPSIDMDDFNGDVVDSSCDDSQISESSPIFESYCHDKAFNSRHGSNESYDTKSMYNCC